ncbi:hypothetical protein [Paenibacillus sp. R14(2021)]|uniref:hypothetical protein n=1 Tax=Paenibacillus sp. R14(2021) TaxID=2859228 RepID=UPI001C6141B7|nr:hypothetical protein [Paenibacillus sp. R14(2021)]
MKKVLSITIVTAIICGAYGVLQLNPNKNTSDAEATYQTSPTVAITPSVNNNSSRVVNVDADYSDGVTTIDDLKKNADLIVYGQVTSQIQYSDSAVQSTINVNKHRKGIAPEVIKVFQLGVVGSDDVLSPGQSYLLFLGKQTDDQADTFFIKGGTQGQIQIDQNKLYFKDALMKKDYDRKFVSSTGQAASFDSWLNK